MPSTSSDFDYLVQEFNAIKPRHLNLLKSAVLRQTVSKSCLSCIDRCVLYKISYSEITNCSFGLFCFSQMSRNLIYGGLWPTKDGKHVIQLLALVCDDNIRIN